jgi:hypothetical protein
MMACGLARKLDIRRTGPQEKSAEALTTACSRITAPPQWPVGKRPGGGRETDMGSLDDEQRVLDGIEYQLLSEDPQLWDCFSALGGLTPPIKPVNGW